MGGTDLMTLSSDELIKRVRQLNLEIRSTQADYDQFIDDLLALVPGSMEDDVAAESIVLTYFSFLTGRAEGRKQVLVRLDRDDLSRLWQDAETMILDVRWELNQR